MEKFCENLEKFSESLGEFVTVWEKLLKFRKISENSEKVLKRFWTNLEKFVKVWKNFEKVWEKILEKVLRASTVCESLGRLVKVLENL